MQSQRSQGLGGVLWVVWCVLGLAWIGCSISLAQEPGQHEKAAISQEAHEWQVLATSPGVKVLSEHRKAPGKVLPSGVDPQDVARNWLSEQGLEEGRNFYHNKLLYISTGAASINATPADPGYIDSRFLAFQRAELEAKAKTAIYLGVDLTTERGSSEREINPEERAALEEIVNASPTLEKNAKMMGITDAIYGLFQKTKILAGAKLDQEIKKTEVDVTAERREAERKKAAIQVERDKITRLRNISEASLKAAACAFADVQGTQIIQSFEGSYQNNYQVVVITLWSQNLQRLVDSMSQGTAPGGLSRKQAKKKVASQLPEDPKELSCLTGVRAYIDQNGEHVLLSFGQAGVEVLGGRKDKAFELAGKKARLRAMAAMRTFMGEKIAFSSTEELKEVLALYVGEYQGDVGVQDYRSISQFHERIRAISEKQRITGLSDLLTRELYHPFTDKPMVFKVMSWSPSAQAAAQELKRTIEYGVEREGKSEAADRPQEQIPARKGIISSGEGADKDAW
ncbi:MAG: hypothetical protein L6406_05935 [Desulfobacterales bacterium]|nr:hypothetical protein [Desulfobacterales bacterium]